MLEDKILKLIKTKPEKGLEKLMDTYAPLVYAIVYNKLFTVSSKEDIEECVSSVFYEAYQKRDSIDLTKGTLKSFLAVVAKRRAIDLYRQKESSLGKVISLDALADNCDKSLNSDMAENKSEEYETRELLIEGIKALGQPDEEIFIRKYYFGQSTKTISAILGIKENTVDKKVSRGLEKLRELFGVDKSREERKGTL